MLPFGLTNAPTTFMFLMNNTLHNYLDKFVLVFIDEIIVFSKNEEEHMEHLRLVQQTLGEHKLYVMFSKCEFYKDIIQYLGHVISKEWLFTDLEKVRDIFNWPTSKYVPTVQSFVGIIGY